MPVEGGRSVLSDDYKSSELYQKLNELKPDILIVDRIWMTLYRMIDDLDCKKVFISSLTDKSFFSIDTPDIQIEFNENQYDKVIAIEPFDVPFNAEQINPLIIRNRNEIFTRETALEKLKLSGEKKICFIGMNFQPGHFEKLKEKYSYMEKEGEYEVIYSTNIYGEGIFPIADYYNAIDLLICPPTYNHFWESRFFNKKAVFEKVPVRFCDLDLRINKFSDYTFKENGADQLADILISL